MKKQLFLSVILILALLNLAIPSRALAANEIVGEQIVVYNGALEFPAGAPFHISHGWIQESDDGAIGIFDFKLEVDGVFVSENFKLFTAESGNPDILVRKWVFNFADGMTGTHTFTGHWFAPCNYAVSELGYMGSCATPNEKVETNTKTLLVNFIP